jgi:hypothetical protein
VSRTAADLAHGRVLPGHGENNCGSVRPAIRTASG